MRRYHFKPADVAQAVALVRDGLVPQVSSAPGFASYTVVDAGDGTVVSLSAFADKASGEASTQASLAWVREHLATYHPQPPQIVAGEIKVRHS